ncbi:TRAP transporter substrate-binding protein DctP [Bacillus dakarensis]|uniref:TRAP transporter substrate-binding protein n=1 Tax=Robertmurraya dakarensis TaxID=1926278 RepID=UPI001F022ED2|nr:TRAP transporter substrate-binding protein DctP [Bacillus dakarensis]
MKKKSVLLISFLVTFALIFSGCSSTSNTSDENTNEVDASGKEIITLKLAAAHPPTHSIPSVLIEPFMERVTELTEGQVEFDYYPAEQLGKAADLLNLAKDGATDIAYYASPYYPSQMPISSNLMGMPGLFEDTYEGTMAFHTISQQSPILDEDFLSNGVRPIATYVTPTYDFYTKDKQIKLPKDLEGMQVRAPGGVQTKLLEFLGATPVTVTTPEMYEAFDKGVINTLYAAPTSIQDFKLNELIGYGTNGASYGSGAVGLVISEKKWQQLPENVKEAINQAGTEVTEAHAKHILDENQKAMDSWSSDGITLHELSSVEKEEWIKVAQEFNDQWIEEQNSEAFEKAVEILQAEVKKFQD